MRYVLVVVARNLSDVVGQSKKAIAVVGLMGNGNLQKVTVSIVKF
jgi:hypothetical protein